MAGGCRKCELFTGRWLGLGEQEGSVPSRLLSRGVRQDANESRNKDLDCERVIEIQEIFSRQSNEGAVECFCKQGRGVLPKQNWMVVVRGCRLDGLRKSIWIRDSGSVRPACRGA